MVSWEKLNNNINCKETIKNKWDYSPPSYSFITWPKCYLNWSDWARYDQNQTYVQVPRIFSWIFRIYNKPFSLISVIHLLLQSYFQLIMVFTDMVLIKQVSHGFAQHSWFDILWSIFDSFTKSQFLIDFSKCFCFVKS